ncbi:MAG: hypothetical protein QF752_15130 [Planctomycetota bacterium]|jgi:hypothetical protein|nr:hypothetical protein [Planctomycetota bacterium]
MLSPLTFSVFSKPLTTFRRTYRFAPLLAVLALLITGIAAADIDPWLPNDRDNGTITSVTCGDGGQVESATFTDDATEFGKVR